MEIVQEGIDDVLMELYPALLSRGSAAAGTRGGILEVLGVTLNIKNPLARVSRSQDRGKPFSALGELLWYLHGSDQLEFIEPYIPRYREDAENGVIYGAYGPRFSAMRGDINQVANIIQMLTDSPSTKRAVIQLFDAGDVTRRFKEVPCTTTMQFFVRESRLHLSVTMRSNDAYLGLPHDVFCFTMLQEMMARRLGHELGEYYHYVGSMHVYDGSVASMNAYVAEGWQRTWIMPQMPNGDPFAVAKDLITLEQKIRHGEKVVAADQFQDPYWADVLRLVQVYWATRRSKSTDMAEVERLRAEFDNEFFLNFLLRRRRMRERSASPVNGAKPDVAQTTS
ncbi:thymidylate synthase [Rhizobium laguerreae]|uniref:thymidylate synthase n=1 Tax=Rhizobium laguerreae TaxID=1076926 RepID=UPI001C90889D|nr:thymidylate synthase [Rhizobium laguerreae]MBY3116686.1 thymidylate synthase [Rhizobium laguerreae]MBY3187906.1 thymidylate synthase [Rhizobium laguerreae]